MKVRVNVWKNVDYMVRSNYHEAQADKGSCGCIAAYTVDHDNATERRNLGEQCRNAFEAGQCVVTYPIKG